MLHTSMKEIVKCTVARRQQTATQTDRHTDIERGTQTDKHAYSPHNSVETYRFTH